MLCRSLRMMMLTSSASSCTRCMSLSHRMSHNARRRHNWVIDSGASVHCISDPSLLTSVYYKHPPVLIKVVDNRTLRAHAVGTAILPLVDRHDRTHHITLHNVIYYHPDFHTNLISVRRLWRDNNIMCRFDPHNYMEDAFSGVKFPITFNRQYICILASYVSSLRTIDSDILHSRFAHASERQLNQLATRCIGFPNHDRITHEPT